MTTPAWQCGCTPPVAYSADHARCEVCGYVRPPALAPGEALTDDQRSRWIGYAQWLDRQLAGRTEGIIGIGLGALIRRLSADPEGSWRTLSGLERVLAEARAWTIEGTDPTTDALDAVVGPRPPA